MDGLVATEADVDEVAGVGEGDEVDHVGSEEGVNG